MTTRRDVLQLGAVAATACLPVSIQRALSRRRYRTQFSGPRPFVVMFGPNVGSSLPGLVTPASDAPDPRGRASVEHDQSMTTISGQ
jgi:hypothetical protein